MNESDESASDLGSLFRIYTAARGRGTSHDCAAIIDAFLMHEASIDRRKSACAKAMGWRAGDVHLREDVLQAAMWSVTESLKDGSLLFEGDNREHFGKWLYVIW